MLFTRSLRTPVFLLAAACGSATMLSMSESGNLPPAHAQTRVSAADFKLPVVFEENRGQTDSRVRYLSRGPGYTLFLTQREAVWSLAPSGQSPAESPDGLRVRCAGGNPKPSVTAEMSLRSKVNYFVGDDPRRWRRQVPTFGRVRYESVYPGIDLVYHGARERLEYDFEIAPGADPRRIRLEFAGAERISIDDDGSLALKTRGGEVRQDAPILYQAAGGERVAVSGGYRLLAAGEGRTNPLVGFKVGPYDRSRELVIDPVLEYSTFLGGTSGSNANGNDDGNAIEVDSEGNAYIAGRAESVNFPTRNAFDSSLNNGPASSHRRDGFVAKLSADGSALAYASYVGGRDLDVCFSIAVDSAGNAYVSGRTQSTDFPTTRGAFQEDDPDSSVALDPIFLKVGPTGALLYSSYLGGSNYDIGRGVAVSETPNSDGQPAQAVAVLTGETTSRDFPVIGGHQREYGGGSIDAFLAVLDPNPSDSTPGPTDPGDLVYSTYHGDSGTDSGYAVAVDSGGSAYLLGTSSSSNLVTTANAFDRTWNGNMDAFLVRIDPAADGPGYQLGYSSFLGGSGTESGYGGISLRKESDASGAVTSVCVAAETTSANFPTTAGALDRTLGGSSDVFVAKFDLAQPPAAQLLFSTFLGGSGADWARDACVDADGRIHVAGGTTSGNFPLVEPLQGDKGGQDGWAAKLNAAGSALLYSTYIGGRGLDEVRSIAADEAGASYLTGETDSSDFPTTPGAFDRTYGANCDAFVTKIQHAAAVYTLAASPSTVTSGESLTVQWTAPAGRPATDWIGLFSAGASNTASVWSRQTGGATSGAFTLPSPAAEGTYEFRYLLGGTFTDVARSNRVTVESDEPDPEPSGIQFRAQSSADNGAGANTLSVARPSGTMSGDVLIAAVSVSSGSVALTQPSGWTSIINASEGGRIRTIVYRRIAGPTEPASYTWSFSAAITASGAVAAYSGVHGTAPINAADGWGNSTSTSVRAPGVTTTVSGAMLLNVSSIAMATSLSPPAGMTGRASHRGPRITVAISEEQRPAAGATGNRTATAGAAALNVGHNIALRPTAD